MARSTCSSYVDRAMLSDLIARNKLFPLGMAEDMWGGACPFCGKEKSFTLWGKTGNYRCFYCGCDGRFVMAPERLAEKKAAERKAKELLKEMVV